MSSDYYGSQAGEIADEGPRPICGVRWPNLGPAGGAWICTMDKDHDGDHEAHGPAGLCADRSAVIPQGHEAILED